MRRSSPRFLALVGAKHDRDDEAAGRALAACAACDVWVALCGLERLPSEWPRPLRLDPFDAFRFNAGVLYAARRYRNHVASETADALSGKTADGSPLDPFGTGRIAAIAALIHGRTA